MLQSAWWERPRPISQRSLGLALDLEIAGLLNNKD